MNEHTGGPDPIEEALFNGRKIEAIKLYREESGASLADAKQAVEQLEQALRAASPEKFSRPTNAGCTTVILLCLTIPAAIFYWIA